MRIAAIDLGSNSFHMLVVEIRGPSSFEVVLQDKMMIQLGRTALSDGRLDAESMERGLRCLDEFRRMAFARKVERIIAVATSAIREAENGEEFIRRARLESGISVRVISGREEARLIHLAVSRHVDLGPRKALMIDIGGGSVELAVGDGSRVYSSSSLKLGFLRLQSRFIVSDPMSRREARAIREYVTAALKGPSARIRRLAPERAIGTSGSITALLRLAQQQRGSAAGATSARIDRDEIRRLLSMLSGVPSAERAKRFDLDPLRAEFLPTAILSLDAILEELEVRELTVCPVALREGLVYDFLNHARPQARMPESDGDLRRQGVLDLAGRCGYPVEHSRRVALIAECLFRQTASLHGLGDEEARLLQYASILHDIGYHIGYAKHHKHAYYIIMNCDLRGFTPEERNILANLVRYHRRARPSRSHPSFEALSSKDRKIVRSLSAILRIADGLDRSHFSLVEDVRCRRAGKKVRFQVFTKAAHPEIEMDLWAAKNHSRYFEKLFGVETVFVDRRIQSADQHPKK